MDYSKLRHCRHADPLKVRQVWDTLNTVKGQRVVVTAEKLVKSLRKLLGLKDDQIRLLLDEIEGDGLVEKVSPSFGKGYSVGYRLPDFSKPCMRGKHDWYCYQCHKPGEVLRCSDCFRVYHVDCAQEASKLSSPSSKSIRSPPLHDGLFDDFNCAVCKSRPKCEYSRKQIRKLLDFAIHQLRKQPLWKTFLQIGYQNDINKNEYLVFKYTDLELLQRKIKDGRYAALEEFSMDIQLLVHDVCILHGPYSSQADEVRFLLRSVNTELKEIQLCTDCYINAKTRLADWISKPCKPPHELIWARNRTPVGAGLYSDAVIAQYYWPAKILLERDDAFEIRFFGGTHERALVKKSDTRPFHIPADDIGVFRRTSTTGALPGGSFERAWNEVTKLQQNIESGYYTHSSGESDLPPSDEDYSDEFYLRPRRGSAYDTSRCNRTNSSQSSSTVKRKRHTSSSSHHTTTSTALTNDVPSPLLASSAPRLSQLPTISKKSHFHEEDDQRHFEYNDRKIGPIKLSVQPGTPGAAAISALAETKAAMAAAVGRTSVADLFDLTSKHNPITGAKTSSLSRNTATAATRGKRGRGRPPKVPKKQASYLPRTSSSSLSGSRSGRSLSSLSSGSNSDAEDDTPIPPSSLSDDSGSNWIPKQNLASTWDRKKEVRGKTRIRRQSKCTLRSGDYRRDTADPINQPTDIVLSTSDQVIKSLTSPGRGRPRSQNFHNFSTGRKRFSSPNKAISVSPSKRRRRTPVRCSLDDQRDDDDDLTDRCCSPPVSSPEKRSLSVKQRLKQNGSPNARLSAGLKRGSPTLKKSPIKRTNGTIVKRHPSSSTNGSSYSSPSISDADSDYMFAAHHRLSTMKSIDDDREMRSPRNKDLKMSGTCGTMLRRPPFAPPLTMSSSGGTGDSADHAGSTSSMNLHSSLSDHSVIVAPDQCASTSTVFSNTGSSLNASSQLAVGVPCSRTSSLSVSLSAGTASLGGHASAGVSQLPRSHLPPNKRAAAAATAAALSGSCEATTVIVLNQQSPRSIDAASQLPTRKLVSRGVQTAAYSCPNCKEQESQRLTEAAEHKRALQELEDRLTAQMKEEKTLAAQTALEQAQATMRETVEREQKLALEAAEARFAEVLVQTKRRQWCRNCLSEAIYHCCWNTSYCSIPCQQEHWQNEHKRQCRRKR